MVGHFRVEGGSHPNMHTSIFLSLLEYHRPLHGILPFRGHLPLLGLGIGLGLLTGEAGDILATTLARSGERLLSLLFFLFSTIFFITSWPLSSSKAEDDDDDDL